MPDKNSILSTFAELEATAKRVLELADGLPKHLLAAKLDDCLHLIDLPVRPSA